MGFFKPLDSAKRYLINKYNLLITPKQLEKVKLEDERVMKELSEGKYL